MNIVHLTDSPFFGGPERQMLGLAVHLPRRIRTTILCFGDHESAVPFIEQLTAAGVKARMLSHVNPRFLAMIAEIIAELRMLRADALVCHGYKADLLGWIAAHRVGIPVLSVSRGWTGHTWKVRLNEALDRLILRYMDRVVCVSEGQSAKVRRAAITPDRIRVIRNAIDPSRFRGDSQARSKLRGLFGVPVEEIVIAVGRLSPEKGFNQLVEAARLVTARRPNTGFVLVGNGPDRRKLEHQVRVAGVTDRFVFAGFRSDVDELIRDAAILAQSSLTEGLPNVVLEACAAGVPVVATDVGGTREVVTEGINGHLVPAGDPRLMARRVLELLGDPGRRHDMGDRGRDMVRTEFSFGEQSARYEALFDELLAATAVASSQHPPVRSAHRIEPGPGRAGVS
jgi:glycosyltransferase involved in cell wall biosynthesis